MPSEINAICRCKKPPCNVLAIACASLKTPIVYPAIWNKGVVKAKTASRNKNVPHGILLQVFCNPESFDVDKFFIVDTANQTEKSL